jgi:hypothetical protein
VWAVQEPYDRYDAPELPPRWHGSCRFYA